MKLYDRIRNMSVAEMTDFLCDLIFKVCYRGKTTKALRTDYKKRVSEWLLKEVSDGSHSPF